MVSNVVEREKTIVNRLQRANKQGKFWRAAWEFEVVLTRDNHEGIPKQKIIQIYQIASIFTQF